MERISRLDIILNLLNDIKLNYPETFEEIFNRITISSSATFTDKELELVLDKLYKDGYVDFKKLKSAGKKLNDKAFYINYDGIIFLAQGGYKEFIKTTKLENRRKIIVDYFLILGGLGSTIVATSYIFKFIKLLCGC